jgi:transposase
MKSLATARTVGVDVSKRELETFELETDMTVCLPNTIESIELWLDGWDRPIRIAVEPTNCYHRAVAQLAHARGHEVYLIDPLRLTHYRQGVGQRVKADRQDAQLLARYLDREISELRRWQPETPQQQQFWHLLKRRATLVRARVQLRQSLIDLGELQGEVEILLAQVGRLLRKMDQALMAQIESLGWSAEVERCRAIPGIGPLTAVALVALYHRGQFERADAFIAFMGMDVRVRQSGQWRGRCKLTKQGDPEVRRLLFNAAMQGRRNPLWEPYYLSLRQRGMSATAAFVALGRKLARVCFALLKNGTDFNPERRAAACAQT